VIFGEAAEELWHMSRADRDGAGFLCDTGVPFLHCCIERTEGDVDLSRTITPEQRIGVHEASELPRKSAGASEKTLKRVMVV
jgi:hypothetical protein